MHTYNVYMNGTKVETRDRRTHKVVHTRRTLRARTRTTTGKRIIMMIKRLLKK